MAAQKFLHFSAALRQAFPKAENRIGAGKMGIKHSSKSTKTTFSVVSQFLYARLGKTRVFLYKKTSPVGFFGFFGVFWVFLGLFAQTRGFLGFFPV
jgi:hypothetical protein